jgi:ABC-type hemin transport system substrate-binding protein
LVSIEEDLKSKAQHIADKISQALIEVGEKPYSRVDEVRAIFIVTMRKQGGSCTLLGRISPADVMLNVLAALVECKIITRDFGKAVLDVWMLEQDARKE